jgi:hypothetical protein
MRFIGFKKSISFIVLRTTKFKKKKREGRERERREREIEGLMRVIINISKIHSKGRISLSTKS